MTITALRPAKAPLRRSRNVEPFTIVSIVGASLFAVFAFLPLWMILAGSFTDETKLSSSGYSLWPHPFSTAAYSSIFAGSALWKAMVASLFITVVGTVIAATCTAGLAWVIARRVPRLSAALAVFGYIPMLFTGGLVPLYILVTQYLHLTNSWFSVILPAAVAPFLVFITVSFFSQLPSEILEAARVDGAGELRTFFSIVLPLSKPILAVIALFYAVHFWNEWFMALLFLSDAEKYPVQLVLQNLIASVANAAGMVPVSNNVAPVYQLRLALTVITIAPILVAYPFAQRYFVKGLTLGASKG
ncbi:MAG: carbohydrate ABC transporter permease [Nocardioides sp.]|uniref:carbohydrate ABC transporter permease n=1 Tax=Nocardioides sp. TaxID=35761 RepID=UPI0039E6F3BC